MGLKQFGEAPLSLVDWNLLIDGSLLMMTLLISGSLTSVKSCYMHAGHLVQNKA